MEAIFTVTRFLGCGCILFAGIWLIFADERRRDGASNSTLVDACLFLGFFTFVSSFVKGAASVFEDRSRPVFKAFLVVLAGVTLVCWPLLL